MSASAYTIPGMHIRDRFVEVPLDWSKPDGNTISIFVREVVDPVKKTAIRAHAAVGADFKPCAGPALHGFLNGGP